MNSIKILSPAKLNLDLYIIDKRDDDYHNISSLMQPINIYDEIKIEISGLDAIPSFTFKKNHLKYKTFLTYIFLQHNYLAANTVYLSTAHTKKIIKNYLNLLDSIFKLIKKFENKEENFKKYYKGKISENFFRRIN